MVPESDIQADDTYFSSPTNLAWGVLHVVLEHRHAAGQVRGAEGVHHVEALPVGTVSTDAPPSSYSRAPNVFYH